MVELTPTEAAHSLHEALNPPGRFLGGVGVGSADGKPALHVMLIKERSVERVMDLIDDGYWEGFPVVVRVTGEMRMCGAPQR